MKEEEIEIKIMTVGERPPILIRGTILRAGWRDEELNRLLNHMEQLMNHSSVIRVHINVPNTTENSKQSRPLLTRILGAMKGIINTSKP